MQQDNYVYRSFGYDGHFVDGLAPTETVTSILKLNNLPEKYDLQKDYLDYGTHSEDTSKIEGRTIRKLYDDENRLD